MSWLEGRPLLEFARTERDVARRNRVALHMFRAWYVPFYGYGVIHGDPHLGNYTVRPDRSVNLLDFGCVRVFPPSFVQGVIDLYEALKRGDEALAVHAYESWGFKGLTPAIIAALNRWAAFVYGPLLEDRPRLIQDSPSGTYGARVAAEVHAELRRLGPVKPPREFVLMDRAAVGLGSVFLHLKAEVNWHRLFHGLIDGFDVKAVARRQAKALQAAGLAPPK
jgi:predicted unusual protein kinase regulating ubiquinone biosynthesis (AarF/ABC1/UbiB family)